MENIFFEKEHKAIGSFPYIELNNPNFNFFSHYHEEMELIFIESGTITALKGADEILLNREDICFFMPGEIHGFKSAATNNIYVIKLNITSYTENIDFWRIRLKNNKISSDNPIYDRIKPLLDEMIKEYKDKKTGYEFAIRHCKNEIIKVLLRESDYSIIDNNKNLRLLNLINVYFEENFDQQIDLESTAKECHFSKYYFLHKLKELTGMTFTQFLNAFRLEKAENLLRNTNISITEIALKCGFSNLRGFNRTFKNNFGTTPSKYRNKYKSSQD